METLMSMKYSGNMDVTTPVWYLKRESNENDEITRLLFLFKSISVQTTMFKGTY